MMRRRFTAADKAQLVQEVLRGEKTIAQIAAAHKVHPNMLGQWKTAAIKGLPAIFDEKRNAAARAELDAEVQELFEQIGRLSIENAWLKKNFWSRTRRPLNGAVWSIATRVRFRSSSKPRCRRSTARVYTTIQCSEIR